MEAPSGAYREVRYEATANFASILDFLGASLLVSTYQAGKVLCLGTHQGELKLSFLNFDRAMGLAVSPSRIAVGTRRQVHFLHASHEIAPRIGPVASHDGCWAMRTSFFTGNIHGHDMAFGDEGLWVVNTLFSSLCTLADGYNFVPRWRPSFVSELIDQDRCHLNGLAMQSGKPKYVSVLAESNEPAGWRPTKATSGAIIDIDSGDVVTRGLAMPHSPRLHAGKLWVLDSGNGSLVTVDTESGKRDVVDTMPGYTRGLGLAGQFAFVGLSKIRETSIFGDLPIAKDHDSLRCGVGVVDLNSGRTVATFQFHSGVEEIFAVEVLPGNRNPAIFGLPDDTSEDPEVWIVPPQPSQTKTMEGQR
jgi:uncharacterized protein (TIGR03032 family)